MPLAKRQELTIDGRVLADWRTVVLPMASARPDLLKGCCGCRRGRIGWLVNALAPVAPPE